MNKKPTMLMILDGFGINDSDYGNAIKAAKTQNLDAIFTNYPYTTINASGLFVGLPDGQMGNSEVGHLNIGAGRIVYQELTRITKSIEDGDFFTNKAFCGAIDHVISTGGNLNIFGLLSDGGVHSHINHIKALLRLAKEHGLENRKDGTSMVFVHCFTDGRDVPPTSGIKYIDELEKYMAEINCGRIGVVSGRFYAMDRDKRWERLEKAYITLTEPSEVPVASNGSSICHDIVQGSYDSGVTDEFILPSLCDKSGLIKNGDSIIFANFRPDRAREITRAFVDKDFDGFERKTVFSDINYVCMTQYDAQMPNVNVAFPPESITNTLGEYVSSLGLRQLRIAETEKYAHVTFFFNGGVEAPNKNEDRILVASPKVATYDLKPEMSALEVTDRVIEQIQLGKYDLIILNFANADMVGHTGVFEAAVKAVETLDTCVERIKNEILKASGEILLTADHGNSDVMLDLCGNPHTAHSTNPVPLCLIKEGAPSFNDYAKSGKAKLCDIAPTLLKLMGIDIPKEMTGLSLI